MPNLKILEGDPERSPFIDNLAYRLAVELELRITEPIQFADMETTEAEHHELQKVFWTFNAEHRDLDWRFATKHFPSPNGQHDIVRVWKIPVTK